MNKFLLSFSIGLLTLSLSFAQISLVKDIRPGAQSGFSYSQTSYNKIALGDKLIFDAQGDFYPFDDRKLWVTDGTSNGTYRISDTSVLWPRNFFYYPTTNKILFSAYSDIYGRELYTTDGTIPGTVQIEDINSNYSQSSSPDNFVEWNNQVYFSAKTGDYGNNFELMRTNGTYNGTYTLFNPDRNPNYLTVLNNDLFYAASLSQGEVELFYESTTIGYYFDINPYEGSSYPRDLTIYNNKIYFSADNGTNGRELWVTDGTGNGTYMVLDIYGGSTGSEPSNFIVYNNELYFIAKNYSIGFEIYKMDSNENVSLLKDINPTSNNFYTGPSNLYVYNNALYFSAIDGINGSELWKSEGDSNTTILLKNIHPDYDSSPADFITYNGKLYFSAQDSSGRYLWVTDGTTSGTLMVEASNINTNPTSPRGLTVAGNQLYFIAYRSDTGHELWKYEDTSLSVSEVDYPNTLKLLPNPTSDFFSIESNSEIIELSIYDLQGKLVKTYNKRQDAYSIEDLIVGMYFVKVNSKEGIVAKKLIVK